MNGKKNIKKKKKEKEKKKKKNIIWKNLFLNENIIKWERLFKKICK